MLEVVLHGFILGFGLILPLGIQNMFVFNQGANQPSYLKVLPVILTASFCDTVLILMAVLGVSFVVLSLAWLQAVLTIIGFFFLLYMGRVLWTSKPGHTVLHHESKPRKQILFAVSVSLMNPHAIMDTIGVIGINSLNYVGREKWAFTISIILVSWLWFFGLAFVGCQFGKRDHKGLFLAKINKISACLIWILAVYMVLQFMLKRL
ncbi:LysE/ArgO family amino acid transporter [Paenibacillus sp. N3.4]|uniref:LysE/ArgO family amino acid transporter n=1 Tax=Paenibacillus sp. N3.4 TaxID=2603222 RepID=UPI0011CAF6BF|nr:LysE/ArgO family amino acid transporter [Paenibacillus sp. N3.4]TXK72380.1 amino acid transporter [Paenibacillus sp. N3.4]